MTTVNQRSFSGGEIAPSLYARADTTKYATGLRACRNCLIMRHGGAQNRAGTQFVAEVKDSTKTVRLIPFIFNSDQTYVLEFGDGYMRVHRNGEQLRLTAQNITGITNANPCVFTYAGSDTYAADDEVYISGITGAIGTYLNGRNFKVGTVNAGANTFTLKYMDGTAVDSTAFGAYTSGGTAEEVYQITTPYEEADLSELHFVQSADVITVVHPNYPPSEVSRTADTSWAHNIITFDPSIAAPTAVTNNGTVETTYTISNYNPTTYVVTTSAAHGYATGDEVYISGVALIYTVTFFTSLNIPVTFSGHFKATVLSATTFSILKLDGSNPDTSALTYSSGGSVIRTVAAGTVKWATEYVVTSVDEESFEESYQSASTGTQTVPTSGAPVTVSWTAATGAGEYNVYKKYNGVWGFIGTSRRTSFVDTGLTPDTSDTPPVSKNYFLAADDFPATVGYYQQRLIFANTNNEPEKTFASRSGLFKNFTVRTPTQDDDAVTFSLAGRQVNEIRHILDLNKMVLLTASGEWSIDGDTAGILRPGEVNPKQYSYNGASTIAPLIIGGNALYVQARGSIVRDLGYDYQVDGYRGNDLTIFAAHLVDGYTIADWAYQQIPHSVVWVVRDDGTLLGLTYVREHQIAGWHRHDTSGTFENVCVVPEGDEDALYVVVKRTVDGSTKRYIERMNTRQIGDIADAVFADAALSYDGRNTDTTKSMTLTGGSAWDDTEELTLTHKTSGVASAYFTSADVGNVIQLKTLDANGDVDEIIRCEITGYTSTSVVTVRPNREVPAALQATATTSWARAVDQVTGLWHLEGEDVSILGDGFVVASPNNAANETVTVTDGTATLDQCYAVIHVGLPYLPDLETLDLETVQGETLADKKKIVQKVTVYTDKTRGVWVGPRPPSDDATDPQEDLEEVRPRSDEAYDDPPELVTGTMDVNIRPEWNSNGRVFIRQIDPLPMAILAVVPSGMIPFRGGG
jgi:hypothetical protein